MLICQWAIVIVVHFLACQSFGRCWQLACTLSAAEIGYTLCSHLTWQMQRKLYSWLFFPSSPTKVIFCCCKLLDRIICQQKFPIAFFSMIYCGENVLVSSCSDDRKEANCGDAAQLFEYETNWGCFQCLVTQLLIFTAQKTCQQLFKLNVATPFRLCLSY